ncbi:hydrogenase/sulfur reductase gamma subunit [Legionella londiniensis]|uniref:Hydrogenase/sulfur reductase subunit gamma n=2 Tax=Legionella londiniensis TaxID=45068 RepID=A0A0W0VT48_9GAMM|nr:hydrogenase/sulfur reductase subunit gamma [Legionella londiniensis]STX93758.1 hydrogenase/sulfur reductase gamma subunit [Legionella londiniensis]
MEPNPCLPVAAEIIERIQESPAIFTLKARLIGPDSCFSFKPGQFNMLYHFGVGEVPISIASDPAEKKFISHTIRAVGRVTRAMQNLKAGDYIALRGPFGSGWPLEKARQKDVVIISGGLGCAPTVSVIKYIMARRNQYGKVFIIQGVKHSDDLIYRRQYESWQKMPDVTVRIAADVAGPKWPWRAGLATDLLHPLPLSPEKTIIMMCGPEMMMKAAVKILGEKNIPESAIYLSMERNMECGIGHCGHCQYGGLFICKDGPVFAYPKVKSLFSEPGF